MDERLVNYTEGESDLTSQIIEMAKHPDSEKDICGSMLKEIRYYSQLALGLAKWTRTPVSRQFQQPILENLARRDGNFMSLLRNAVVGNDRHPTNRLLAWAGIGLRDVEEMVGQTGLEETLQSLYKAGVYLTHDEFKGKIPVQRGSMSFDVQSIDLANPLYRPIMEASSSGSRGNPTPTRRSLEYQQYRELQELFFLTQLEIDCRDQVVTTSALPATGGLRRLITHARYGHPVSAWLTIQPRLPYRILTGLFIGQLRLLGVKAPFPRYLPKEDFAPIATWLAERKRAGRNVVLTGSVSPAVRVAAAAHEMKLDISGTRFVIGGESITSPKLDVMERAGVQVHARYTISELGPIGFGCRQMRGNCIHVSRDSLAVISRTRTAPLSDTDVESLLFTTLLPFAPTVAVNLEMDDAGQLGVAQCNCELKSVGLVQQIDRIFSYGKLTGYGTSLMAGDILSILERSLPGRFGGVPSDYQLIEMEAGDQTEIELRVHPRLSLTSENEVREFFLREVSRIWAGSSTSRTWTQAGGFRIAFAEPLKSGGRKVHPLHLLRGGQPSR